LKVEARLQLNVFWTPQQSLAHLRKILLPNTTRHDTALTPPKSVITSFGPKYTIAKTRRTTFSGTSPVPLTLLHKRQPSLMDTPEPADTPFAAVSAETTRLGRVGSIFEMRDCMRLTVDSSIRFIKHTSTSRLRMLRTDG
jgi:hypothetical protein